MLTAGLGTRFRPLSASRAKAAVPIAGRPLVHRIIEWLASYEVRDLVLNLHHRPETITRELGDGSDLGVRVRYSWEQPILGSAGGPRRAWPILDARTCLIINGDTLTDLDLRAMWEAHRASGALVTMALIPNPRPDHYGGVMLDEAQRIVRFTPPARRSLSGDSRQAEAGPFHFIGAQIVSASVFEPLDENRYAESVNQVYPALLARDPDAVRGYVSDAEFQDIGTPRDYLDTALRVARREGITGVLTGHGTVVDGSAVLADCVLWDDVTIGPRSRLTRCVVADRVQIAAGSCYEECAIVCGAGRAPIAAPFGADARARS